MQAVILLGGQGTRMRALLGDLPKALAEIRGKPLLAYLLDLLGQQEIRDVILCTGVGGEAVERWAGTGDRFGVRLRTSPEAEPLGTAGALRNIPFTLRDSFLVLYGDVLVSMDLGRLLDHHREKGGLATLVVHPSNHPYDSDLVVVDGDGRVTDFPGKPKPGVPFVNLTNAALYAMRAEALAHIPPGECLDLGRDVFPRMLREGARLFAYPTDEYLKDVGTPERLREAEEDILQGRFPGAGPAAP